MAKKLLFFPFLFLFLVVHQQAAAQDCTDFTENTSVSISTEQSRTICDGDDLSFNSSISNYSGEDLTYQWTLGGNPISNADQPTLTHQFSSTDNGKKIRLTITSTCDSTVKRYSNELTITVNTNRTPTVSISADKTSICPEETVTFTASQTYGGDNPTFAWYINSETTPTQEGTSNTFSTTGLDQSSNTVKVVMTSSLACVISSTAQATSNSISLKPGTPVQPGNISLPTLICPGVNYTYSVAAVTDATSYLWTLPDNSTRTTSGPDLDLAIATAGDHSLSVQAVNECGTSTKQTTNLTVNAGAPAQPGTISIPELVCPGVENSYSFSAIADADEYIWTLHDNSTVTTTDPSLPITFDSQGSFSLSVRASNECGDSAEKTFSITVNAGAPDTPGSITGENILCPNTSNNTYGIADVDFADSYEWVTSGNLSIDGAATGTSVNVSGGSTGSGTLQVRAINECGESQYTEEFQVEIYTGAPDAVSISTSHVDAPNFCPGEEIVFSVPADAKADTYTWTVPQGWSYTVNTNPNEITATAGNLNDDGDITVTINNDHCGSVSDSFAVSIQNPAPQMGDISIDGPTSVCHEDTGLVYSIPAVEYATEYIWSVPGDWTITSADPLANQITVNAGTDDGAITVYAKNHCGPSAETISLPVSSVDAVPSTPGEISSSLWDTGTESNDPICPPATGITFSVTDAGDADSYNWILPNGWEITEGKDTENITVKVTASAKYNTNETIYVEAVNICGPSSRQTYDNIVLSDYVQVDAGEDKTVCRTTADITIEGFVNFNGSKMKINASSSGTGSFIGIPNGKVDTYSIKYKPSQQDIDNLEQVVITVTTDAPVGACGPGEDEMIIFFRDNPAVSLSGDATICSGTTSPLTFTGSPNTQVTYTVNGGTSQKITIGPSGEVILDSGVLTQNTTYDLVSAVYTDAPACSGNISGSATITVTQIPTAEISYSNACTSGTSLPVTLTGTDNYTGGTFTAPAEVRINSTTGEINPSLSTSGTYTVTYTIPASGGCQEIPVTTEVTIREKVVITTEPVAVRACEGGSAQFEVQASGEGLTYQWYKGAVTAGNEVAGGTSNILSLSGLSVSDAGDYLVVVSGTDPCAPETSAAASLVVDENIVIQSQPIAQIACEAGTAEFTVEATSGGSPLGTGFTYQWFKGTPGSGTAIGGATSASLQFTSAALTDSGDYYVEISGPSDYTCDQVTSSAATLTVRETPTVTISGDASICSGTSADIIFQNGIPNGVVTYTINNDNTASQTFNLDASGAGVLNTGALVATSGVDTDYVYTLQSVTYPDDPMCSTSVSGSATITVAPDPDVTMSFTDGQTEFCTADATSYTPTLNGTGTFSGGTFSATGLTINSSTGAFTPQGQTPGDYVITYTIPAYGGCPEETISLPISIYEEVKITAQPFNVGICSTQDAQFSITATGDNLTYQWFKDGSPIAGAEGPVLDLPVATSEDAGQYFVRVSGTNACTPTEESKVDSDVVTLNVDEDIVIIEPAEDVRVCETGIESVQFRFVAHANGAPLSFTWVYGDGSPVTVDGNKIEESLDIDPNYNGTGTEVYIGTLTINNIVEADENRYAVHIDGSDNGFSCPTATSNAFLLEVEPIPTGPGVKDVVYCLNEEATALTAEGTNLLWYDSPEDETPSEIAPVPPTDVAGEFFYYVSQTPLYCESELSTIKVTVNTRPSAPALTADESAISYCMGETASALTATPDTGASLNWYDSATSTTPLASAPVPPTTAAGTLQYWVSQTSAEGCEGDQAVIDITINQLPNITPPENTTICSGDSIDVTASDANVTDGSTTFSWDWTSNSGDPLTGSTVTLTPAETTTYTITASNSNGCINTEEFTISVDDRPVGGSIDGPASVCITDPSGTLTLIESAGSIDRWEYLTGSATEWTAIANTTTSLDFSSMGFSENTRFRAVLTNGVCEEVYSEEHLLVIDPEPLAGGLLFKGTDRVFMMCEFPTSDYLVPLHTSGEYVGQIVAWQYRRNSGTEWVTIMEGSEPYTGTTLSGQQVIDASANESTMFRVEVQSGACEPNVYSETATLSIIPSDIAPNPVTASPGEICLGDIVTLNAGTGYGGYGVFQGGAFDNSSIANHGWRVMRFDNNTEYTFESAADNTRPDRWMRTNPHEYIMADPDNPGSTMYQLFDSSSGDEGNKGFAIVSGNNPSTLETPVFNLYATDDPVLTFDQAYNLTPGDTIKVQISLDGGNTYVDEPLFVMGGPNVSENYASFGDGDLESRPLNKMSIDMSKYAGMGNLRIRWLYDGSTGGIYTIDDIGIPQDPDNVQLIWYYDDDLDDPNNELDQIGDVNQNTVTYTPTKIGWNYFEVQTALVFDTNGDPCQSAENMATIQVYVFDTYTTSATAEIGSCGTSSVPLTGIMEGAAQGVITEFPAEDASTVAWEVINSPDGYTFSEEHFDPSITDPNAIFDPGMGGAFSLQWTITPDEDSPCEPTQTPVNFEILDCTTLDFDGVDDYVDLGNNYTGNYFIEAWIRPFDRPFDDNSGNTDASTGTVISGPGFEIAMADLLVAGIQKNNRWYHIAVANNGNLWIDGIASGNISVNGHGGNKTIIGAKWDPSSKLTSNHFSGWIEEVRIWKSDLTQDQIRFMMNQRLINNGAEMGEQIPMPVPEGLTYSDLAGYYRLISEDPDPANLVSFDPALMPQFGETPDLAVNSVPGRLHNMTTNQQNTAPLPYISAIDGQIWETDDTWIRPDVWDPPNSAGVTGDPIEWNIAITNHNIDSGNKDITLLGLKSMTVNKLITMANPSSTMDETNSGQMMRVTHYLLLDGNMDLVGESQLLQDEGSILDEASAGWLERDQQGKMLSFNYNYWSSPVSAQGAANNADYSVAQVLLDGTNSASPQPITFDDRYHIADNGRTNPITISNYWIWKFLGTADIYEEWFHIGSTGTLATGEGYTMKGTDGTVGLNDLQNYVFKGKPHNGNFTRAVSKNQNYLVGNPYPSAISAKEFILDNMKDVSGGRNTSNIFNGAIYYWDHFAGRTHYLEQYIGGYATWTLAGGVVAISNDERILANDQKGTTEPGEFIPVAQGFFVNTVLDAEIEAATGITVSGGDIIFRNRQRIYERENGSNQSIFHSQEKKGPETATSQSSEKQASEDTRQKIWLKFKSPMGYHRQLLVTADPNTSDGFDLGYDAPLIEDNAEDMYWYFNNYEFVIQAVEDFNADRELALGMKVHEEGNIVISIDNLKNIPDDLEIFLKDSLLEVNHDLRKNAYRATSDTGTYHNRFKVIFKDPNAVVVEEPEVPEAGEFEILYVNGSREILVKNPELLNIERIYLNNVLGQQLHVFYDVPAEKELRLPVKRFSSGVYIVKVHSEKGIRTKKVILE
ncbi:Por secretion system C-terminal sorting domain-containing protein [Salinimicrobium catena]|uniref:Por secretion system C-terminal sorting domain-containing protein n=1 Tax=Salinimicrobium catena TaxID=390640 RepID=A0A1H5PD21_9FLAO|nr:T9SS type A sorting domain-containing protein [Salinimicrobium catena]SDL78696.1 Por secretion system C-terminal sorting domain-containing protein [Salinimicrobium catena]SEF11484.1 Por secretion system C-terminal sorting domain-containing protein [Salinimicrobium catena]